MFKSLFVDLKFKNQVVTCGTVHRSPKQDKESNLEILNTLKLLLGNMLKARKVSYLVRNGRHKL